MAGAAARRELAKVMAPARERKPVQRLLVGRVMICEYLQVSNNGFKEFLKLGLPVRVINRTYYAHAENIDIFMRQITAQTLKDEVEGVE